MPGCGTPWDDTRQVFRNSKVICFSVVVMPYRSKDYLHIHVKATTPKFVRRIPRHCHGDRNTSGNW
ncbi:hypothetical protein DSL72_008100 [Monilinia vaccinii-corymbosi]|uniref:Uncharacterized protein n=1 Tax=Monilinia vaccinii-corymbosi TaxID=61207 RepID=A0A8A3PJU8_9HELO|nr:hypothetical protein DSL72_008100 [Monilinia vaccinii-corymbosi]